jgi:hypothetical protein
MIFYFLFANLGNFSKPEFRPSEHTMNAGDPLPCALLIILPWKRYSNLRLSTDIQAIDA